MGNNRVVNAVNTKKPDSVKPNSEMTDSERNRVKQENKAKANPEQAARNKEINDRKRLNRIESGSTKQFS
jgi:hypothetical protein